VFTRLSLDLSAGGRIMTLASFVRHTDPEHLADGITSLLERIKRRGRGCAHLDGNGLAFACYMHPAAGVMCLTCAARHAEGHTEAEEHTCDRCGEHLDGADGDTWHMIGHRLSEVDALVSTGRGRYVAVGLVTVVGIGYCWSCHFDIDVLPEVTK
jgi:hypothetical protein